MTAEVLNEILKGLTIGEPIKSLFNPSITFLPTTDSERPVRLSIRIDVASSNSSYGHFSGLESSTPLTRYMTDRYCRDHIKLSKFILECLVEYMRHEVEESLFFNGNHVTTPKHWGPFSSEEIYD